MSVRLIPREIFARVASTAIELDYNHHIMTPEDHHLAKELEMTDYDYVKMIMRAFVMRLHLANQVMHYYHYEAESGAAPELEPAIKKEEVARARWFNSTREFLEALRDIRYNLYSDLNRSFTSAQDFERLESLIDLCQDKIIYGNTHPLNVEVGAAEVSQ